MESDTATQLATRHIVDRQSVTFIVGHITQQDILDKLAELTGLLWHIEPRHSGGHYGDIYWAETMDCAISIPIAITASGAAYLSGTGTRLGEFDQFATNLLFTDDVLPLPLAKWVDQQERQAA